MKKDIDLEYDFGFSAVHESELESVQSISSLKEKVDSLYSAIQPLLGKLKQDAGREYIFWPNRAEKVEEFEKKLRKIYEE